MTEKSSAQTTQFHRLGQSLQERMPSDHAFHRVLQGELDELLSRWDNLTQAVDHLSGLNPETAQAAWQDYHETYNELDTIDQFLTDRQIRNIVFNSIYRDATPPGHRPTLSIRAARLVETIKTSLDELDKASETAYNDDFRTTEEWAAIKDLAAEAAAWSRAASAPEAA